MPALTVGGPQLGEPVECGAAVQPGHRRTRRPTRATTDQPSARVVMEPRTAAPDQPDRNRPRARSRTYRRAAWHIGQLDKSAIWSSGAPFNATRSAPGYAVVHGHAESVQHQAQGDPVRPDASVGIRPANTRGNSPIGTGTGRPLLSREPGVGRCARSGHLLTPAVPALGSRPPWTHRRYPPRSPTPPRTRREPGGFRPDRR